MPSTFTPLLRLSKPGLNDTGWGTTVNNGTFELIDSSIAGLVSVDVTSGATLTTANGATDQARNMFIRVFGATTPQDVIVPATNKLYFVINDCTADVTFKVSGQTGVTVPARVSPTNPRTAVLRCDGTDIVPAITHLTSLTLASALPVNSGGTGITSFGTGVATALGQNVTGSGGIVLASGPTLGPSTFTGGAQTTPTAVAFSATAMTVDCSLSNVFTTTFTANVTNAPTFSNPRDGQTINWFITQDGTGGRTITWPASFKWPTGTATALSIPANSVDLVVATYINATGFWYASLSRRFI